MMNPQGAPSATRSRTRKPQTVRAVPVYHCLPFLDELSQRGADPQRAMALLGICTAAGEPRSHRVAETTFRAFLRLTEVASNDPCIGLEAGRRVRLEALENFDLLLQSPSHGELAQRHFRAPRSPTQNVLSVELSAAEDAIVCCLPRPSLPRSKLLSEYVLAAIVSCTRQAFGDVVPLEVQLAGPAPLSERMHQRRLGKRLTFSAARDAVLLPLDLLTRPTAAVPATALAQALSFAQATLSQHSAPGSTIPYACTLLQAFQSRLVRSQRGL
jgi:hypothetical protein